MVGGFDRFRARLAGDRPEYASLYELKILRRKGVIDTQAGCAGVKSAVTRDGSPCMLPRLIPILPYDVEAPVAGR